MLVGDRRQPRQPLQIFCPGEWVVHSGVAGVLVQIGHRRVDGPQMGGLHDFFSDVGGAPIQPEQLGGTGGVPGD